MPKGHNDVTRAIESIALVQPEHAWITHIGHELDVWLNQYMDALPDEYFYRAR
ncbi:MAG: hypothetical protein V9G21_11380 [Methylotenera sp.]